MVIMKLKKHIQGNSRNHCRPLLCRPYYHILTENKSACDTIYEKIDASEFINKIVCQNDFYKNELMKILPFYTKGCIGANCDFCRRFKIRLLNKSFVEMTDCATRKEVQTSRLDLENICYNYVTNMNCHDPTFEQQSSLCSTFPSTIDQSNAERMVFDCCVENLLKKQRQAVCIPSMSSMPTMLEFAITLDNGRMYQTSFQVFLHKNCCTAFA